MLEKRKRRPTGREIFQAFLITEPQSIWLSELGKGLIVSSSSGGKKMWGPGGIRSKAMGGHMHLSGVISPMGYFFVHVPCPSASPQAGHKPSPCCVASAALCWLGQEEAAPSPGGHLTEPSTLHLLKVCLFFKASLKFHPSMKPTLFPPNQNSPCYPLT